MLTTTDKPLTAEFSASFHQAIQQLHKGNSAEDAPAALAHRQELAIQLAKMPIELVMEQLNNWEKSPLRQLLLYCWQGALHGFRLNAAEKLLLAEFNNGWKREKSLPALIGLMILAKPWQVPDMPIMDILPPFLWVDATGWFCLSPMMFLEKGEAEQYQQFTEKLLLLAEEGVLAGKPYGGLLLGNSMQMAAGLHLYFSDDSLQSVTRQRAKNIELYAGLTKQPLNYGFSLKTGTEDTPIHIGLLAFHFSPQTETYFLLSHLTAPRPAHVRLTLYSFHQTNHPLERLCRSHADNFVQLPKEQAEQLARIRKDDLDILYIGTNVAAVHNPVASLAQHRLARQQAILASSPCSTGFTAADIYISARDSEPTAEPQKHYNEELAMLPGILNYYAYQHDVPEPPTPFSKAELGLRPDMVVFFSGANFFKLTPQVLESWANILAATPDSQLILMPFGPNWSSKYPKPIFCAALEEAFAEKGVAAGRVVCLDPVDSRLDLLKILGAADIYLDSFPFGGACSVLDPLLMGVPVVAMQGKHFRGHVAASMLGFAGLDNMACPNQASYQQRAIKLAENTRYCKEEATRVKNAMAQAAKDTGEILPYFASQEFSAHFHRLSEKLVHNHRNANKKMLSESPKNLLHRAEYLMQRVVNNGNPWFFRCTDLEMLEWLVLPYYRYIAATEKRRLHGIDVGAAFGSVSIPWMLQDWSMDMFEPDPECYQHLLTWVDRLPNLARLYSMAVTNTPLPMVEFHKSSAGLSGLGASPFGNTQQLLRVPAISLLRFMQEKQIHDLDFLKIDAEGYDFEVLKSHDFKEIRPKLVMTEFGSHFSGQSHRLVMEGLEWMKARDYTPLIFSHEDDGNFIKKIWEYRLIGLGFHEPVKAASGEIMGNVIFFDNNDQAFLAHLIRLLEQGIAAAKR